MKKRFVRLWLTMRHQIFGRRHGRLAIEYVEDVSLVILPEVFNPVLFRTGEFLARAIVSSSLLNSVDPQTPLVLDLGCGSGIGSIFAARQGARVIASDVNPEAIRCVRLNAILNRVDDKIEPRLGDLFSPVKDERFDLILFNPPFYRGKPENQLDLAWRGEDIFERFVESLEEHLTAKGQAWIVLSTDGEGESLLHGLKTRYFVVESIDQRDFGNEVITVYQVGRAKQVPEKNDYSL